MHRLAIVLFAFVMIAPLSIMFYFGLRGQSVRLDLSDMNPEAAPTAGTIEPTIIRQLPPVDHAEQDLVLLAFRDNLLTAVRERDGAIVAAAAADDIALSFGGDSGRENFARNLAGNGDVDRANYWQELETTLALGGILVSPNSFCTPYLACVDLGYGSDPSEPFNTYVALTDGVQIHVEPDQNSDVKLQLSYDIIKTDDADGSDPFRHYPWIAIKSPGEGFVLAQHVRSPADYRAWLEKIDGVWQLTAFVTGD